MVQEQRVLLKVEDLKVSFAIQGGRVEAVRGVSFQVNRGSVVALVGESGSGKSVIAQAILRILPRNGSIDTGSINFFDGPPGTAPRDIAKVEDGDPWLYELRGGRISMVFQEPMTALSPLHTIGNQIEEALRLHHKMDHKRARSRNRGYPGPCRFPRPGRRLRALSVRALGRPAPARGDRHGADLQPGNGHRRRADHRAGRHRAGADPQADEGPAEEVRDRDPAHHA